jgi:hypothetical protein
MNASEMRHLLLTNSKDVILQIVANAKGEDGPLGKEAWGKYAEASQKKIWDAVIPMLQQAGDLQKVTASNHSGIIQCLKDGVISIKDAKELMGIVQMQFEMTELAELAAKLDASQSA